MVTYEKRLKEKINKDISLHFKHLFPITPDMKLSLSGVSRLVMLDRYTQKIWN